MAKETNLNVDLLSKTIKDEILHIYKGLKKGLNKELNKELSNKDGIKFLAIDGRCGAGKSTIAKFLKESTNCSVISMDDFFLRKEQRSKNRLSEPGGNVDRERIIEEVLLKIRDSKDSNKDFIEYRPFDCSIMDFSGEKKVPLTKVIVLEGSYSMHPDIMPFVDYSIFVTLDKEEQLRRIENRNGKTALVNFIEKWIPMEENYFNTLNIMEKADRIIINR